METPSRSSLAQVARDQGVKMKRRAVFAMPARLLVGVWLDYTRVIVLSMVTFSLIS